jgi:DNA-binding transcriptional LysR family regulator
LIVKSGATYKATQRLQSLGPAIRQVLTILQQEVVGLAAFDPSEDNRPFVIATSDVGEMMLLPSLIQAISAKAPRVAIRSVVIKPIDLKTALGDGTLDLAVGYFPDLAQATIVQQTLFSHAFACLVKNEPSAHQKQDDCAAIPEDRLMESVHDRGNRRGRFCCNRIPRF